MPNHPDETELEVDRSQLGLDPLEPTDEDLEAPEFDDMDVPEDEVEPEEGELELPEVDEDEQVTDDDVAAVLDENEEN